MSADDIYASARMAAGYAFSRPAVHPRIIERIARDRHIDRRVARALDIGCGAGLSTAALETVAERVVGLEPERGMLAHRREVAPRASFVVARAERLPFAAGSFDLVTAAGSLNYVDLDAFLPELARVMTAGGLMVVYDFSAGRRLRGDGALDAWYAEFERRYPPKPGYAMDVGAIPFERAGLRLEAIESFEVAVPMTLGAYVRYAMSETGVELAVGRGMPEAEIEAWCTATLAGILRGEPRDVLFDAYVAYVVRTTTTSTRSPAAN